MALIVEDGTAKANAESYATVAQATAYLAARAKGDAWDAVEDKEAALRLATDYIEQTYRGRWIGDKKTNSQALSWPRDNAMRQDEFEYIPGSAIPTEVVNACCEMALRTASGDLLTDLDREVASESISGAVSVTYAQGGSRQKRYEAVERMLRMLLTAGAGQVPMERA